MLLDHIPSGTAISIEAYTEDKNCELSSVALTISDEFHSICSDLAKRMGFHYFLVISPIYQENAVINFDNFMLHYDLNVILNEELYTWRNVTIKYIPMSAGKYVHIIFSNRNVEKNNRRKTFRLWLGYDATCSFDDYKGIKNVTLKDLSIGGMGIVMEPDSKIVLGSKMKVQFQEQIDTPAGTRTAYRQYTLQGIVVRINPLPDGNVLIGCQFPSFYQPVSTFIADKQRQRARLHVRKVLDQQHALEQERIVIDQIRQRREKKSTSE